MPPKDSINLDKYKVTITDQTTGKTTELNNGFMPIEMLSSQDYQFKAKIYEVFGIPADVTEDIENNAEYEDQYQAFVDGQVISFRLKWWSRVKLKKMMRKELKQINRIAKVSVLDGMPLKIKAGYMLFKIHSFIDNISMQIVAKIMNNHDKQEDDSNE